MSSRQVLSDSEFELRDLYNQFPTEPARTSFSVFQFFSLTLGEMGSYWLCRHSGCDAPVVEMPDDSSWLGEAELAMLAASLRHPSCVPGQTSDDDEDSATPCCPLECSLGCVYDRCAWKSSGGRSCSPPPPLLPPAFRSIVVLAPGHCRLMLVVALQFGLACWSGRAVCPDAASRTTVGSPYTHGGESWNVVGGGLVASTAGGGGCVGGSHRRCVDARAHSADTRNPESGPIHFFKLS